MTQADQFAAELKEESAKTRSLLERVPDVAFSWKPHKKSMSLGEIASHLADILQWMNSILDRDDYSFDPATFKPYAAKDTAEILERFDAGLEQALNKLKGYPEAQFSAIWRLKAGERVMIEMPRAAVLRYMVLNHTVHHRGQLSVYLRMNDVPLPGIYGPSADVPPAY